VSLSWGLSLEAWWAKAFFASLVCSLSVISSSRKSPPTPTQGGQSGADYCEFKAVDPGLKVDMEGRFFQDSYAPFLPR